MTSRALVLGGGGPVGIAWESGLIAGLTGFLGNEAVAAFRFRLSEFLHYHGGCHAFIAGHGLFPPADSPVAPGAEFDRGARVEVKAGMLVSI